MPERLDLDAIQQLRRAVMDEMAERDAALAEVERLRAELRDAGNDLLDVRGILSPNGYPSRVPVDLVPTVAPAVQWLVDEVERLARRLAALDNRWLEGCCEHRDPESVDLWRGTPCPTCAQAVDEVESAVTIDARKATARAILGAFHDLHPRIPGLDAGDCHCNLIAEVALTALVAAGFVIRPATPRATREDI